MATRGEPSMSELLHRLSAIEARLVRLEAGRAPPGDGRAAAPRPSRPVERCPGCGLPLRRRAGRCQECGVPLARSPAPTPRRGR